MSSTTRILALGNPTLSTLAQPCLADGYFGHFNTHSVFLTDSDCLRQTPQSNEGALQILGNVSGDVAFLVGFEPDFTGARTAASGPSPAPDSSSSWQRGSSDEVGDGGRGRYGDGGRGRYENSGQGGPIDPDGDKNSVPAGTLPAYDTPQAVVYASPMQAVFHAESEPGSDHEPPEVYAVLSGVDASGEGQEVDLEGLQWLEIGNGKTMVVVPPSWPHDIMRLLETRLVPSYRAQVLVSNLSDLD